MNHRARLFLLILPAILLAAGWGESGAEEFTLDRCAELVRLEPDRGRPYRCYWAVSRAGQSEAAHRALEALLTLDKSNSRALYYLAHIERDRGNERAIDLYRRAAGAFEAQGNLSGKGAVLLTLADELRRRNRMDEAGQALEQATETAEAAGNADFLAQVQASRARFLRQRGNYGGALRLLFAAEQEVFPDGPLILRMKVLDELAVTYLKLERTPEALRCYRRKIALPGHPSAGYQGAYDHYMITRLSGAIKLPTGQMSHSQYLKSLKECLDLAMKAGHHTLEGAIRRALGRQLTGGEAIGHLQRALEIARARGQTESVRAAQRSLAIVLAQQNPPRREEALEKMAEALEGARRAEDPAEIATTLLARTELLSPALEREEWTAAMWEAVAAVEELLDRQPERGLRTRILHRWAHVYLRFSGRLLSTIDRAPDTIADLELALGIIERMRSRVLAEELELAGIDSQDALARTERGELNEIRDRIAQVQRRLANPDLEPGARHASLAALEQLEREENLLLDLLARTQGDRAPFSVTPAPSLRDLQDALAPDAAILSFQLSRRLRPPLHRADNGGSWLLLVTSTQARAFPLKDRDLLEKQIRVFLGLCRRSDGAEAAPSSALYRELLDQALLKAGPSVRRLIIVPDGVLHHLPFAALRPSAEAAPLGTTHEIVEVPSVSLWRAWRGAPRGSSGSDRARAALALADPRLLSAGEPEGVRSAAPWLEGLRVGPLPRARAEAGEMVRNIGGESRMLAGANASERFLKTADLATYGIIHLAAHAVVDFQRPERSAILLAPGAAEEDGFLQAREIAELDAGGRVVILSACQSATGPVVRGEGVLGLARSFFAAGARAVIGNLWEMHDDDAERFVGIVSRRLAKGDSLAAAVRIARKQRFAEGAPATAWAGVVVLGDGDFIPMPGGRNRPKWTLWLLPVIVAFLVVGATMWTRRRTRKRSAAAGSSRN